MKQTFMPCLDCAYALQARNPDLENLWSWLTDGATADNPFRIATSQEDELSPYFHDLESMRFIVTHEDGPRSYIIKILGFTRGSSLICIHRHMP